VAGGVCTTLVVVLVFWICDVPNKLYSTLVNQARRQLLDEAYRLPLPPPLFYY
jgi:hypothetical protein